jgi:hypothetical protein
MQQIEIGWIKLKNSIFADLFGKNTKNKRKSFLHTKVKD